jgi:hypothetical protein
VLSVLHTRPYIAVVARGESRVFRTLVESVRDQGLVEVIWDRRLRERRRRRDAVTEHRRLGERRRPAHDTWPLGFILASRYDGVVEPCKTVPTLLS